MRARMFLILTAITILASAPVRAQSQQLEQSKCKYYGLAPTCTKNQVFERVDRMWARDHVPDGTYVGRPIGSPKDRPVGPLRPAPRAYSMPEPLDHNARGLDLQIIPTTPMFR